MPLEQRVVNPIYVSRGCFSLEHGQMSGQPANVPNELECVTNGTLGNIIRQLSSLSKHAEDLFGSLLADIGSMLQRSGSLQKRIDGLTDHVGGLDSSTDSIAFYNSKEAFHRKQAGTREQFDQQVVARTTIPAALREVYDQCDAPPSLDKLNPFRDDNINGLKLYTNPNYFFELWRKEMLSQDKNKNKVKLKGENAHQSSKKRNKARTASGGLPHQSSMQSNSTATDSPYHPSMVQQQIYGNHQSMVALPPAHHPQQQHYHPQAIYGYQQQPVEHLIAVKREEPNPNCPGTRTVVEGAYLDKHNYQHHYVQYHPQQQAHGQVPPPPPPNNNNNNNNNMYNGQTEYQQGHPQSRPNSLELSQQQQQGYPNGPYYQQQAQQYQRPPNNYGSPAGYGQGQYPSPNSTLNTPTRRATQLSRPSAAPPPPPGSGPNSQPSTPLHKSTRMINGQEVEMRGDSGPSRVSRDSLPPPPPPPPNQVQMNGGGGVMSHDNDVSDPALPPPPPPPPPPSQAYNGSSDSMITSPPPPPPPPMMNGGGAVATPPTSQQYKSTKPTAEELQSVKLKKTTPSQAQPDPADDVRSNLLAAIRHGIKLRRVEESKQREVDRSVPLHDVASILARRVAMEMSDSEGDAEEEDDSDAWDDESEC